MVYLNNDDSIQDVYIPRNDGQGSYVSKYDQGFADGINYQKGKITSITITENGIYENEDGYSPVIVDIDGGDCPEPSLQTKTVVVTADTETITPDAEYDGFGEVNIDASDYGQDKYDEGYGNGEDDQKARLSSATFVENGHYELENGWSAVTVQTTCLPCPEPSLENKTVGLESGTTLPATITPSSGYDGFSEVTIEDNGYGNKKYDEGFSDGQDDIRNNMSSTAFTQNGNYSNSSGWSAVTVDVPTSGIGNLQNKSVVLTAGTQTVVPDAGFDGMTEVDVDATEMLANERSNGYSQGADDVRNQFTTTAVTQNGTYQMTGDFNAFSSFTVNVSASCSTVSDFKTIVTGTDETVCVGFSRPSAPSGETVYGGSYERLKWFMDNYGDIVIISFTDQEHSDEIEEGYFTHRNDQYIYYNYQRDISFPLDEIGPRWTNTGNNDKFFLWGDGMNIFFYTKYEYGWETNYVVLPPENLILQLAEGDAAECMHIDSSEVRQAGYDDGYADGQAACPLPNLENKTLYLNSGDTSPWTVVPSSGYDGMSEVTVRDNGYGQKKYDDGYADGYNDAISKAEQPIGLKLDGNSWFDTGIYPDADTKIELFFVPTDYISDGSPLYYAGADNGNGDNSAFYISQEPYPSSGWTNVMSVKFGNSTNNIEIHDNWNNIEHTTKLDSGTAVTVLNYDENSEVHAYEYNGYIMQQQSGDLRYNQTANPINFSGMDTCNYTIFIGANNNPSLSSATPSYRPAKCIILCARIYDNGTLVGEFIPRLNNGIPCLYDSVSQTYKNNLGTGTVTPIFGNISLNPRYI